MATVTTFNKDGVANIFVISEIVAVVSLADDDKTIRFIMKNNKIIDTAFVDKATRITALAEINKIICEYYALLQLDKET